MIDEICSAVPVPLAAPDLPDFRFGVILSKEQIDVRRVLLADPSHAPPWGAATFFIFDFPISIFVFRSKRISHGYIDAD